jgi:hypothetical protein
MEESMTNRTKLSIAAFDAVVMAPCACGHAADWHAENGTAECEHDGECGCKRFRSVPMWVGQKHANGCVPACVAMVLGESYEDVCAELTAQPQSGHDGDWDAHGIDYMPMDRLLGDRGYFIRRVFVAWNLDPWPPQPFAPVHIAQVNQPNGHQHSVVMDGVGRVLDPLRRDVPLRLYDWPKVNNVVGLVRA